MKVVTAVGAIIGLFAAWLVFAANPTVQLPPLNDTPSGERLPGKFIWFDFATNFFGNQIRQPWRIRIGVLRTYSQCCVPVILSSRFFKRSKLFPGYCESRIPTLVGPLLIEF